MPTVVFDEYTKITREDLQIAFAKENIDARVFFHALSNLPMFEKQKSTLISSSIPKRSINLPSYHDLTRADQDRVMAVIKSLISH
jgi:perosamine synthetase